MKTVDACSSYLNRSEATKEVFLEDGWVRTGDVGYFDENGLLYLSERIKDMIKVCGCQVPPTELETILLAHPMAKWNERNSYFYSEQQEISRILAPLFLPHLIFPSPTTALIKDHLFHHLSVFTRLQV